MSVTVKPIPEKFNCPPGTIFDLPTKEDLVNAIQDIAKIPSDLRVFLVEVGEDIKEDVKAVDKKKNINSTNIIWNIRFYAWFIFCSSSVV